MFVQLFLHITDAFVIAKSAFDSASARAYALNMLRCLYIIGLSSLLIAFGALNRAFPVSTSDLDPAVMDSAATDGLNTDAASTASAASLHQVSQYLAQGSPTCKGPLELHYQTAIHLYAVLCSLRL